MVDCESRTRNPEGAGGRAARQAPGNKMKLLLSQIKLPSFLGWTEPELDLACTKLDSNKHLLLQI